MTPIDNLNLSKLTNEQLTMLIHERLKDNAESLPALLREISHRPADEWRDWLGVAKKLMLLSADVIEALNEEMQWKA